MTGNHASTTPSTTAPPPAPDITPLFRIMARLRDPINGCPWDVVQDFSSIVPYTIEEAYEVADAIAHDDMAALCDELGDLLLQVVFHSRMAEEAGHFSLADVIAMICDKMTRRHPHVFGAGEPSPGWEVIKAEERRAKITSEAPSALDGVALALPALLRAQKLQKRAARTGFDWPDIAGVRAKIEEEITEVEEAENADQRHEEIGDLLFAVVNLARHLDVDAETALRDANAKFARRFAMMEQIAGEDFPALDLDAKEDLWRAAKLSEQS